MYPDNYGMVTVKDTTQINNNITTKLEMQRLYFFEKFAFSKCHKEFVFYFRYI